MHFLLYTVLYNICSALFSNLTVAFHHKQLRLYYLGYKSRYHIRVCIVCVHT